MQKDHVRNNNNFISWNDSTQLQAIPNIFFLILQGNNQQIFEKGRFSISETFFDPIKLFIFIYLFYFFETLQIAGQC